SAYYGRGDVLALFERRGFAMEFSGPDGGLDALIAACARGRLDQARALVARFAGPANLEGVRCLLDLGVPASALWAEGDAYWTIGKNSTALHVAAWRAHHDVVRELIAGGAPVNAVDARGRTALSLAVAACIDSYWKERRRPDSVAALLEAGATTEGI